MSRWQLGESRWFLGASSVRTAPPGGRPLRLEYVEGDFDVRG